MKIKNIKIEKLFGELDYDININTAEDVSILIGPNGCGKTTIFKLLNFILSPNINKFREIYKTPFSGFSCTLSNGYKIKLSKTGTSNSEKANESPYFYLSRDIVFEFEIENPESLIECVSSSEYINNNIQGYESKTNDRFDLIFVKYVDKINETLKKVFDSEFIVNYVSTNRLEKDDEEDTDRYNRYQPVSERMYRHQQFENGYNDPLIAAKRKIQREISKAVRDYNDILEEKLQRLPWDYVQANETVDISTFDDFEIKWNEFYKERQTFYDLGLLPQEDKIVDPGELKVAYEKRGVFLKLYLDALTSALETMRDVYDKLKLFSDIYNNRNEFSKKTIKFSPVLGVRIKTASGSILGLDNLSSGEKHDFIMFYNLIFNCERGSIFLIDEPEISLHIVWQEEYIDQLIKICEMNGLQAIVATHSPNIISGHVDLIAEKR